MYINILNSSLAFIKFDTYFFCIQATFWKIVGLKGTLFSIGEAYFMYIIFQILFLSLFEFNCHNLNTAWSMNIYSVKRKLCYQWNSEQLTSLSLNSKVFEFSD